MPASEERSLTLIVVPHGGANDATRTYEISPRRLRRLKMAGIAAGVVLVLMVGSWFYLAAQATRVQMLQRSVHRLEGEVAQKDELRRQLVEAELRAEQISKLLGRVPRRDTAAAAPRDGAPAPAEEDSAAADSAQASLPRAWPLAVRGFVTRGQKRGVPHPGMDIAVPRGTRIMAAGDGTVAETGRDSVYGLFVRIAHHDGYESLYGHASRVMVRARQRVRRREVIALSGSTGVSTAPHLHFEIRRNGVPVDPVTLVQLPE